MLFTQLIAAGLAIAAPPNLNFRVMRMADCSIEKKTCLDKFESRKVVAVVPSTKRYEEQRRHPGAWSAPDVLLTSSSTCQLSCNAPARSSLIHLGFLGIGVQGTLLGSKIRKTSFASTVGSLECQVLHPQKQQRAKQI